MSEPLALAQKVEGLLVEADELLDEAWNVGLELAREVLQPELGHESRERVLEAVNDDRQVGDVLARVDELLGVDERIRIAVLHVVEHVKEVGRVAGEQDAADERRVGLDGLVEPLVDARADHLVLELDHPLEDDAAMQALELAHALLGILPRRAYLVANALQLRLHHGRVGRSALRRAHREAGHDEHSRTKNEHICCVHFVCCCFFVCFTLLFFLSLKYSLIFKRY